MPSIRPNTAARTPFLKGSGLTGVTLHDCPFDHGGLLCYWRPRSLQRYARRTPGPTVLTICVALSGSVSVEPSWRHS